MSNVITLGKEVMVSDPCYSPDTWCQRIVKNVKPGEYRVFCKKVDLDGWGNRVSMLMAVHSDHEFDNLKWKLEGPRGIIGVDSGQAGIFDLSTYRVNPDNVERGDGDTSFFGLRDHIKESDEEKWYVNICSHTLGDKHWGHYKNGVVSSSGIGDGGYDLFVSRVNRKVVAFAIEFGIEEELTIDFEWYKDHTNA